MSRLTPVVSVSTMTSQRCVFSLDSNSRQLSLSFSKQSWVPRDVGHRIPSRRLLELAMSVWIYTSNLAQPCDDILWYAQAIVVQYAQIYSCGAKKDPLILGQIQRQCLGMAKPRAYSVLRYHAISIFLNPVVFGTSSDAKPCLLEWTTAYSVESCTFQVDSWLSPSLGRPNVSSCTATGLVMRQQTSKNRVIPVWKGKYLTDGDARTWWQSRASWGHDVTVCVAPRVITRLVHRPGLRGSYSDVHK